MGGKTAKKYNRIILPRHSTARSKLTWTCRLNNHAYLGAVHGWRGAVHGYYAAVHRWSERSTAGAKTGLPPPPWTARAGGGPRAHFLSLAQLCDIISQPIYIVRQPNMDQSNRHISLYLSPRNNLNRTIVTNLQTPRHYAGDCSNPNPNPNPNPA